MYFFSSISSFGSPFNKPKTHHAFGQHLDRMGFQILEPHAGPHHIHADIWGFQHQVIDFALCLREFAVDRESASDVGSIAFVFRAGINQQQIAIFQYTLLLM